MERVHSRVPPGFEGPTGWLIVVPSGGITKQTCHVVIGLRWGGIGTSWGAIGAVRDHKADLLIVCRPAAVAIGVSVGEDVISPFWDLRVIDANPASTRDRTWDLST